MPKGDTAVCYGDLQDHISFALIRATLLTPQRIQQLLWRIQGHT